jgi:protein-tyrosine phosphatase
VKSLRQAQITPLVAHPERNDDVQRRPELVQTLVDLGAVVQVTAASLDGRFGRATRRAARTLLARRLVHVLASDAHGPDRRDAGLTAAVAAVGDDGLAHYLVEEAPEAITLGVPIRPPPRLRRRRLRLF